MEEMFDLADEYEKMLDKGISATGEKKEYFIYGRIADLQAQLPEGFEVNKILDYGCGTGETTVILKDKFPEAEVVGSEISEGSLAYAKKNNDKEGVSYIHIDELQNMKGQFDLAYTNGVFHHIPLDQREFSYQTVFNSLKSPGYFGYFENNPYNPATKYIMSKVPFDRDAITITYKEGKSDLSKAGFNIEKTNFLFYFPNSLSFLRGIEKGLKSLPLGGQYHILAKK